MENGKPISFSIYLSGKEIINLALHVFFVIRLVSSISDMNMMGTSRFLGSINFDGIDYCRNNVAKFLLISGKSVVDYFYRSRS